MSEEIIPDEIDQRNLIAAYREQRVRVSELERQLTALGSLLAVIHRDGGHYQHQHGTEKACRDAEAVVQGLRTALESISRDIYCDGPGCPFCEADEPHPPSISAIAARAALVGAPTKGSESRAETE